MKCQCCEITEFTILYNTDHPIEKQPVIICRNCWSGIIIKLRDNDLIIEPMDIKTGKRCNG